MYPRSQSLAHLVSPVAENSGRWEAVLVRVSKAAREGSDQKRLGEDEVDFTSQLLGHSHRWGTSGQGLEAGNRSQRTMAHLHTPGPPIVNQGLPAGNPRRDAFSVEFPSWQMILLCRVDMEAHNAENCRNRFFPCLFLTHWSCVAANPPAASPVHAAQSQN